jgi:hypothetical protein
MKLQTKQNEMKTNTALNLKYFNVSRDLSISSDIETGSKEWYQAIRKSGYKFAYRWINSDESWMFFAKTNAQANEGAAELFSSEKNEDIKYARKWYYEHVDVLEVENIINEWF